MTVSKTFFSKSFSTFLLSPTWQGSTSHFFCRFLPQFLQGFPPSRPVRLFYPSFLFYFHDFMYFFMHLGDIFGPLYFWDSWWFKACFLKLIVGFWWDIGIFMFGVDYFDQFGALWKIENFRVYAWIQFGDFVKLSWNWWNWLVVLM